MFNDTRPFVRQRVRRIADEAGRQMRTNNKFSLDVFVLPPVYELVYRAACDILDKSPFELTFDDDPQFTNMARNIVRRALRSMPLADLVLLGTEYYQGT